MDFPIFVTNDREKFKYLTILSCLEIQKLISLSSVPLKIKHTPKRDWYLNWNPVETANEKSNIWDLEGRQIWIAVFFFSIAHLRNSKTYVSQFRSAENQTYVEIGWNLNWNPVETPNGKSNIWDFEGPQNLNGCFLIFDWLS
jgi:hypothetical protein